MLQDDLRLATCIIVESRTLLSAAVNVPVAVLTTKLRHQYRCHCRSPFRLITDSPCISRPALIVDMNDRSDNISLGCAVRAESPQRPKYPQNHLNDAIPPRTAC
ncbi:hypothetical protein J6590_043095 [Homalodisca vitripennis]|nr:hypothetical protein J6590_043095 [Homalodisca vitripennis]